MDSMVLLPEFIFGAEEEAETPPAGDSGNTASNGTENAGSNSDGSEHEDSDDPRVKGLKTALQSERAARKTEKAELTELRKLKAQVDADELAKKSEVDQARIREEAATERLNKLASGYVRLSLNQELRQAAITQRFIDPDDAIAGVDFSTLSYEQDKDDPSQVVVDKSSIEKAVKALAAKKPHFLKTGTTDGEPSGSQFGAGKKQKKQTTEDELRHRYPGL